MSTLATPAARSVCFTGPWILKHENILHARKKKDFKADVTGIFLHSTVK